MPTGEYQNSPSISAKSFQFGAKSQIAAHYSVCREGQRIFNFKNCFVIFSNSKKNRGVGMDSCLRRNDKGGVGRQGDHSSMYSGCF